MWAQRSWLICRRRIMHVKWRKYRREFTVTLLWNSTLLSFGTGQDTCDMRWYVPWARINEKCTIKFIMSSFTFPSPTNQKPTTHRSSFHQQTISIVNAVCSGFTNHSICIHMSTQFTVHIDRPERKINRTQWKPLVRCVIGIDCGVVWQSNALNDCIK